MFKMYGYLVLIETESDYLSFEFFKRDGEVDDEIIARELKRILQNSGCTNISASEVLSIEVIATDGFYISVYGPKIEDVWPRDFGNKDNPKFFKKDGEQNEHGTHDFFAHSSADNL